QVVLYGRRCLCQSWLFPLQLAAIRFSVAAARYSRQYVYFTCYQIIQYRSHNALSKGLYSGNAWMRTRADYELSLNKSESGTSTQGRSIGDVRDKSAPTG